MRIHQIGLMSAALATISAMPVLAGPVAFDCDVPANRYSSVSQEVGGPMKIEGSVQLVQARSGANLPVAGARLVSSDDKSSVGFQLVVPSARATQFDVVLNLRHGGNTKRATVTRLATDGNVPFSLSISDAGKVAFKIGEQDFHVDFVPLKRGTGMAFCSTAQFKFIGLLFHQDVDADANGAR